MEGFAGSIPQKFIDNRVNKCPMCGSTDPHWAIDQKIGFTSNNYLFKCEKCDCILSSPVTDVTGFGRTPLSDGGLIKMFSGKKVGAIYLKIVDVGTVQTTKLHEGKEMTLEELNKMAEEF
jgi:hypothetical protein